MRVTLFSFILLFFLLACKNKSSSSSKELVSHAFYPDPTCEEIQKAPLHDAILFFDVKGLVEEKNYSILPDEKLRKEMLSDSSVLETLDQLFNFVVINGTCDYSKEIMNIYEITSFPTILRTDKNGNPSQRIIGLTTLDAIKKKLLLME